MLDDRDYMREQPRQSWSMTTILLVSLVACFAVQTLGGWRLEQTLALSLAGLKAGKIYQLLTFQFLHHNLWHLVGNLVGLYFFGRAVEDMLGGKAMLKLYLLSGTIGGLVQVALGFFPYFGATAVVGASAGVFGLIAAFATMAPNQELTMLLFFFIPLNFKAKILLLILAVTGVVGLIFDHGNIAHAAHLGGMLTGIAFIKWNSRPERTRWTAYERSPVEAVRLAKKTRRQTAAQEEEVSPGEFISREVDPILDKISAKGIHSLTDSERKTLESARKKMARK